MYVFDHPEYISVLNLSYGTHSCMNWLKNLLYTVIHDP